MNFIFSYFFPKILSEIEYIIYSYLNLENLVKICDYQIIDQIIKRYPIEFPEINDLCDDGNLEVLKYLVYQEGDLSDFNLYQAIINNDFKMIKYLFNLIINF